MNGRGLVLLLPGQGSQFAGMATELYRDEPGFTRVADEFFAEMGPPGERLRREWLAGEPIDDGTRAQPLLFLIGFGVGRLLAQRGARPDVLIGHSVGELAAAALAGVYDLPAAARIMAARARCLAEAPSGGMLGLAATAKQAAAAIRQEWAEKGLVVGAFNGPQQTVLSGAEAELVAAEASFRDAGITALRVRAHEPWHSPVLRRAALTFTRAVQNEVLQPPRVSILSTRTAKTVDRNEAIRPEFWGEQMAEPVRYWEALSSLLKEGEWTLLEAGPGKALSMQARKHPAVQAGRSQVINLLPAPGGDLRQTWHQGLTRIGAC